MIGRIEFWLRRWRRRLSRSEWLARLLQLAPADSAATDTGLILIQIDGLSRKQLERALNNGEMPFLKRLLDREHYHLHDMCSGAPSTTPAVQAELLYGVKTAVPGFAFVDRQSGQFQRMFEPSVAAAVEEQLKKSGGTPLLTGGSCYASNFSAGAAEAHFCPAAMGWGPMLRRARPGAKIVLLLTHSFSILRIAALLIIEFMLAIADCIRGLIAGKNLLRELIFIPTRVLITILMRELISIGVKIDIARGMPTIFANFLGYDEQAHRRGPDSAFAHWTLKGIDSVIAGIWTSAHHSERRHYDVWIYSDHGQEKTVPYEKLYGQTFAEALTAAIARSENRTVAYRATGKWGIQLQRAQLLGGKRTQRFFSIREPLEQVFGSEPLLISTVGPVAMLYLPDSREPGIDNPKAAKMAQLIVEQTGAPLVLFKVDSDDTGKQQCAGWWRGGLVYLPTDGTKILGQNHPFPEEISRDLIALCHHPKAGDLVICGWCEGVEPISFATENGAHCGAGPNETRAFALLPKDVPITPDTAKRQQTKGTAKARPYWRPADLREAALAHLHTDANHRLPAPEARATATQNLRLMTYNLHRCLGMDGKLAPERVARVIARHSPDVVALQELDVERTRSDCVDQAKLIAQILEMEYQFHPTLYLAEGRYGNAILSRLPMRLVKAQRLPANINNEAAEARGVIWVVIEYAGREIQVFNTHLGLSAKERNVHIDALLGSDWLNHPDARQPRILCGDFNAGPQSKVYARIGTELGDAQLLMQNHCPAGTFFGRMPRARIDHIFVDSDFAVTHIEVPRTQLATIASDHLPLIAELQINSPAQGTRDSASRCLDKSLE